MFSGHIKRSNKAGALGLVVFACLASACSTRSNVLPVSEETATIVKELAKGKFVEDKYVAESGEISDQFCRFLKLLQVASDTELVILADNKNATVRCYAMWGLSRRQPPGWRAVLQQHENDRGKVRIFSGCLISQETVSKFIKSFNSSLIPIDLEVNDPDCQ